MSLGCTLEVEGGGFPQTGFARTRTLNVLLLFGAASLCETRTRRKSERDKRKDVTAAAGS